MVHDYIRDSIGFRQLLTSVINEDRRKRYATEDEAEKAIGWFLNFLMLGVGRPWFGKDEMASMEIDEDEHNKAHPCVMEAFKDLGFLKESDASEGKYDIFLSKMHRVGLILR